MDSDSLIGLALLAVIFIVGVSLILLFLAALIAYPLFRILIGGILIWVIWASTTGADTGLAWFGTAVVGLMMLSPWLVIIGIVSFVIGFLAVRK